MDIDLARLCNTTKNANLLPDAVLEISFLIYGAYGATDLTMATIVQTLFINCTHIRITSSPKYDTTAKVKTPLKTLTPGKFQNLTISSSNRKVSTL
jgi:hypothetical protein